MASGESQLPVFKSIPSVFSSSKWLAFGVVISLYFTSYLYRVSTAVIAPNLVEEFNIGPKDLALLSSMYFYTFALAQFPLGPALDRLGPRIMCFSLGIVAAVGAMVFAWAPTFMAAVAGRALIGLGVSVAFMGTLKVLANWFRVNEFATMSALGMGIGNVGALSATFPLALMTGWIGWRMTFLILSVMTLFSAVAIWIFVRDRPTPQPGSQDSLFSPTSIQERIPIRGAFYSLIVERSFWMIACLEFFWFGTFIAIQGLWGGPYLMHIYGLSPAKAGSILAMIAIGIIFGGPILGRLSDRVFMSRKKVIITCLGIYVILILTMALYKDMKNMGFLYALFFLFGFMGSSGLIAVAHIKELFPLSISGTVMTCINFFTVAGGAIVMHIMGYIVKSYPQQGSIYPFAAYRAVFIFCAVGMLASIILYSFSHERKRG
ncbi:MAG: MFS transporter [Pseudomonadota bacterium]